MGRLGCKLVEMFQAELASQVMELVNRKLILPVSRVKAEVGHGICWARRKGPWTAIVYICTLFSIAELATWGFLGKNGSDEGAALVLRRQEEGDWGKENGDEKFQGPSMIGRRNLDTCYVGGWTRGGACTQVMAWADLADSGILREENNVAHEPGRQGMTWEVTRGCASAVLTGFVVLVAMAPDGMSQVHKRDQVVRELPPRGHLLSLIDDFSWPTDCNYRIIYRPEKTRRWAVEFHREEHVFCRLPAHDLTHFVSDGDLLFYPLYDLSRPGCTVVAYDLQTGCQLWKTALPNSDHPWQASDRNTVQVSPSDGRVWVGGSEGQWQYAGWLDARTGELDGEVQWVAREEEQRKPPLVSGGPCRFAFDKEKVIVFDEDQGWLGPSLFASEGDFEIHLNNLPCSRSRIEVRFVKNAEVAATEFGDIDVVFRVYENVLYWIDYRMQQGSGCRVRAIDLSTGRQLWATEAIALGHWPVDAGTNRVNLDVNEKYVCILGLEIHGGYQGYREVFDRKSGERVLHRVYTEPKPIVDRPDLQILDSVTSREEALEAVEWLGGKVIHGDRSGEAVDEIASIHWPREELRDEWLSLLEYFPELQWISLGGEQLTDAGLVYLRNLRRLNVLSIWGPKVTDEGLKHLSELDRLRELHLGSRLISDAGLEHITSLNALEKLAIFSDNVKGPGLAYLNDLENLAVLNLTGLQLAPDGLSHLTRAPRLKELLLGATPISGKSLVHLRNMPTIEVLDLTRTSIADDGLRMIAPLTALVDLRLPRTRIVGAGLRHLVNLRNLRSLDLSYTPLTDEAAEPLGELTSLTVLSVSNTSLTSASLAHLKKLRKCQALYLMDTQISDVGLEQLAGMPALLLVKLSGTKVTAEGVRRLSKQKKNWAVRSDHDVQEVPREPWLDGAENDPFR